MYSKTGAIALCSLSMGIAVLERTYIHTDTTALQYTAERKALRAADIGSCAHVNIRASAEKDEKMVNSSLEL
eukprot:4392-Heterococcus_DN1.PRE.7